MTLGKVEGEIEEEDYYEVAESNVNEPGHHHNEFENDEGEYEDEEEIPSELLRECLIERIHYSEKYKDENFEYRHVILPRDLYEKFVDEQFKKRLLDEAEWRAIGIRQSPGWYSFSHFMSSNDTI